MTDKIIPNPAGAAGEVKPQSLEDKFAAQIAVMRNGNLANQSKEEVAKEVEEEVPVDNDVNDTDSDQESIEETDSTPTEDSRPSDDVNDTESDEKPKVIDFKDLAETAPNQKFRFMRGEKEVVIDAKKAFAILGQGAAVSDEARELKIQKAAFEEERAEKENHYGNLLLALEFTAEPRLKEAADGLNEKVTYMRALEDLYTNNRQDPVAEVEIGTAIRTLANDIEKDRQMILNLRPKVAEYRKRKAESIAKDLEEKRVSFEDKELKNKIIYNELSEKIAKEWPGATKEHIPGVPNLSIVMSDEKILSLIRDGLKYRAKPVAKQVGTSVATSIRNNGTTEKPKSQPKSDAIRKGDKKASYDLFMQVINQGRRK